MRLIGLSFVAATLVVGCAGGPSPSELDDRRQLGRAYIECLRNAARQTDDGVSDLLTVALAIKPKCGREWLTWTNAYASRLSPGWKEQFIADKDQDRIKEAAEEVAAVRMQRRAPR